jgi:hypothetical protein
VLERADYAKKIKCKTKANKCNTKMHACPHKALEKHRNAMPECRTNEANTARKAYKCNVGMQKNVKQKQITTKDFGFCLRHKAIVDFIFVHAKCTKIRRQLHSQQSDAVHAVQTSIVTKWRVHCLQRCHIAREGLRPSAVRHT